MIVREMPYGVVHKIDHGPDWPGACTTYALSGKWLRPLCATGPANPTSAWLAMAVSEKIHPIPVAAQNQREKLGMSQEQYRNYRSLLHRITKERIRGRLKAEKDWPRWAEIEKMAREAACPPGAEEGT